eukprot:15477646-Alexandrium_andersonii.AAC.1
MTLKFPDSSPAPLPRPSSFEPGRPKVTSSLDDMSRWAHRYFDGIERLFPAGILNNIATTHEACTRSSAFVGTDSQG